MTRYLTPVFQSSLFILLVSSLALAGDSWTDYRGPSHNGVSDAKGVPVEWGEEKNVKWKTKIHGLGWSTPVILDGQIWFTTADEEGHKMHAICVDQETGKIIHDKLVFENKEPEPLGNDLNCYASPSAVLEKGRVYVHFGTYGTACLDTKTAEVLWQRRDINCSHFRGPGSSPILYENLIILTLDGIDKQFTEALDKKTGKTVWHTKRSTVFDDLDENGQPEAGGDMRKSYSTPLIGKVNGKDQMFIASAMASYGMDPKTGKELWFIKHNGYSLGMRSNYYNDHVYLGTGYMEPEMFVVKPDGSGDVTESKVAWKRDKRIPIRSTPVIVDDMIFMVEDEGGVASCVCAKSGKMYWGKRIKGDYSASPVYVDGKVYFFDERGRCTVVEASKEYKKLAYNKLDDGFMASAAVVDKAFYLRTKTHLYRIEE